jgi:hypothetical protein
MGDEHERASMKNTSRLRACGTQADGSVSNPQSRDGAIENYGLRSEVLYVSKLDCAKIIPNAEQKCFGWKLKSLAMGSVDVITANRARVIDRTRLRQVRISNGKLACVY